jgi:hypothetical protein
MWPYLESEEKLTWVNAFFPLVCYHRNNFKDREQLHSPKGTLRKP